MNGKDSLNNGYVHLGKLNQILPKLHHGLTIVVNKKEYQAGSVVGYAIENGKDPYAAVLQSVKQGHENTRLWINACAIRVTSSNDISDRDIKRYNEAPRFNVGDLAIFEGNVIRLVEVPNQNIGLEYLSKTEIIELQIKLKSEGILV